MKRWLTILLAAIFLSGCQPAQYIEKPPETITYTTTSTVQKLVTSTDSPFSTTPELNLTTTSIQTTFLPEIVTTGTATQVTVPQTTSTLSQYIPTTTPLISTSTPAETIPVLMVNGIINLNTIWEKGYEYHVNGNILVNEGITLTIEKGVHVIFDKPNQTYYTINIKGTLIARGTKDNNIILDIPWGSFVFSDSSTDWHEDSQIGSVMEYCSIEINTPCGIVIEKSSPLIKDCIIKERTEPGGGRGDKAICVRDGNPKILNNQILTGEFLIEGGSPYISNNLINGKGINISLLSTKPGSKCSPTITKNEIAYCSYEGGIRISYGISPLSPVITYNNIHNNSDGIVITYCGSDSEPIIQYNNIHQNERMAIKLTNSKCNVIATNNWWGTTDINTINKSIYDNEEDFTLGHVIYTPFALSKIINAEIETNP
jgi:hypothetical protein